MIPRRMPVSGPLIRKQRERAGLKPSAVADAIGMDRGNYSRLEAREGQNPKVGLLETLAEMFGCTVTDFLTPNRRPKPGK